MNPNDQKGTKPIVEPAETEADSLVIRIIRLIVIPLVTIGIGLLLFNQLKDPKEKEKKPPSIRRALKTKVIKLHIENYTTTIETNGIVSAHNEISLTSQVPGRIVAIHPQFEDGAFFEKDTVLLELEEADFATSVASAKAQLAQAIARHAQEKAKSAQARLNWEDLGYDEQPNELVLRLPQLREAEAQVEAAKTQLAQSERNLMRSKIRAPFSGRVRKRLVGISQAISRSTPLGTLFAVDYAEVRLPISGSEMRFLELPENPDDPPVDVRLRNALDEENETEWSAQVIRTEGTLDQNSLELFAIARITDPFGRVSGLPPLRIGQPVIAAIPGRVLENVIKIPRSAVRQLRRIYLVDKDKLKNEFTIRGITVKPIRENEEFIIIRDEKITEGTLLSTSSSAAWIPDGAKVEVVSDTTASGPAAAGNPDKKIKLPSS